jgi:ParB family transcriptional regulator, chromosome partitioning protein
MSQAPRGGLGRGLSRPSSGRGLGALIPGASPRPTAIEASVEVITPDPNQPRRQFKEDSLLELSASIKEKGLIQPIVVRPIENGQYQIIAGERRWRASKLAGLTHIPIISKRVDDLEGFELALLENIQREDLTPIEEANAFKRLSEEFKLSHEQIAKRTGKSRSAVSNMIRLLSLSPETQALIDSKALTPGHGRAILSLPSEALQNDLTSQIIKRDMSVRQAERWATLQVTPQADLPSPEESSADSRKAPSIKMNSIAEGLSRDLKRKVKIKVGARGGQMILKFKDEADLIHLSELLSREI